MPHSSRQRVVALTRTRKHLINKPQKQAKVGNLRQTIDNYSSIYIIRSQNIRNTHLKKLRSKLSESRFYHGRLSLAQIALGRDEAEEYLPGTRLLSKRLTGNVGLFFTNKGHEDIESFFKSYERDDFARSGFVATQDVSLSEGELEFEPSQESNLRLVGLPVCVKRGKICLTNDFVVCEEGDVLTPERAKILEFLGMKMATFKVNLVCRWSKDKGFEEYE